MTSTLLVDPPFTREEWAVAAHGDLSRGALGERLAGYLALYSEAVVHQGRARLNRLLERAGISAPCRQSFPPSELRQVLRRLANQEGAFDIDLLEQLLAVNHFVDFLSTEAGIQLDEETRKDADLCRGLGVLVLIVCINQHFGFQPATPRHGLAG